MANQLLEEEDATEDLIKLCVDDPTNPFQMSEEELDSVKRAWLKEQDLIKVTNPRVIGWLGKYCDLFRKKRKYMGEKMGKRGYFHCTCGKNIFLKKG